MKTTLKLLTALALCAIANLSFAIPLSPKSTTDNAAANGVGIVTPDIATSVIVADYFSQFKDTGEFALCASGRVDTSHCEGNKYLTPAQYVAKFYPKARYVGFRLLMSSQSGSDTYLYIYISKMPLVAPAQP